MNPDEAVGQAEIISTDESPSDVALAFDEIIRVLNQAHTDAAVIQPTALYNEGWLTTLFLSAERRGIECLPFRFAEKAHWGRELSLKSPFASSHRGDPLGETQTNADALVGHFRIRAKTKRGIEVTGDASQFIVVEAKMNSQLSPGVRNCPTYNQAARTIACMALALKEAGRKPTEIRSLGFYVFSPREKSMNHEPLLKKQHIRDTILARYQEYTEPDRSLYQAWCVEWLEPLLEKITIAVATWEEMIELARKSNPDFGRALASFYNRCTQHA